MFKSIVVVFLLLAIGACSSPKKGLSKTKRQVAQSRAESSPSSLKQRFLEQTRLKENRDYFPTNQNEAAPCLEGTLEVLEIDGESLSIRIGGRLLVSQIQAGESREQYQERECRYRQTTRWDNKTITMDKRRICGETKYLTKLEVQIDSPTSLQYKLETFENKNLELKTTCQLEAE